jgi:hypothetical protein
MVRKATKKARATKKVAKKHKPLSPEARAKLAQNLVKARAARAAKRTPSCDCGQTVDVNSAERLPDSTEVNDGLIQAPGDIDRPK